MHRRARGLTHKEMREIRNAGRGKALDEMRRRQAQEIGPCCRICGAPLEAFPTYCAVCGTQQKEVEDAGEPYP